MVNVLDDIFPKILSSALESLRENIVTARLVNSSYSSDAAQKGQAVEVPVPTAIAASPVVPANIAPNPADLTINTVPIVLNNWQEAAFYLTDKDIHEIMDGAVNMQVMEAGKTIANAIDASILANYIGVFNFVGVAGTTPFATDTVEAQNARKLLNTFACRMTDRRIILDVDADANATGLPAFQQTNRAGTDLTITEGLIGRKLGFDWHMDQLMPAHEPARVGGEPTGYLVNEAGHLVGDTEVEVDTGTGEIAVGDLFTVAGDTSQYVVTNVAGTTVTYDPPANTAFADDAAITFVGDHAVNLAFHRDAMGLAIRTFQPDLVEMELGGRQMVMVDPISGVPLRLEVRREHKRVRYAIDALWGTALLRPECVVRILG